MFSRISKEKRRQPCGIKGSQHSDKTRVRANIEEINLDFCPVIFWSLGSFLAIMHINNANLYSHFAQMNSYVEFVKIILPYSENYYDAYLLSSSS